MEVNFGANYNIKMPELVEKINLAQVAGRGLQRVDHETGIKMDTNVKDLFITELREGMTKAGSGSHPRSKISFAEDGSLNVDSKMERSGFFSALGNAFANLKNNGFLGNLVGSDEKLANISKNVADSYKFGFQKSGEKAEVVDLVNGLNPSIDKIA